MFRKGIEQDQGHRRREETSIRIRKEKRAQRLSRRRRVGGGSPGGAPTPTTAGGVQAGPQAAVSPAAGLAHDLAKLPALVAQVQQPNPALQLEAISADGVDIATDGAYTRNYDPSRTAEG